MINIYLIPLGIAIFFAINMGASGTAPAFSAPYGANLLRKEVIPGIFGVFVLLGGVIAGEKVIRTIGGQILPAAQMDLVMVSIVLLSCALSLQFANLLKVPQSTSQSTVFALVGSAACLGVLKFDKLAFEIIPTWLILPLICFVLTLFFGKFLFKPLRSINVIDFEAISNHRIWKVTTILCSCYVAFSIGSNNVANAAGPIASMLSNVLGVEPSHSGMLLVMAASTLLIAPWFGIGSSLMGKRVLETTGKEIIHLGSLSAAFIAFITASLLLLASVTRGIPTSLVQLNAAAIIAVGITKAGGRAILSKRAVLRLFLVWIVAPLIALALGFVLTAIAVRVGLTG